MNQPRPAYRVFISYSHNDAKLVARLEKCLRKNGLTIMRDKHFAYGVGFREQIKRYIAYAHVFVPVLTKQSSERGWVHQEIGFAIAHNVPVLPIAIDWEPGEWLQTLHSVMLHERQVLNQSKRLRKLLSSALFHELVIRSVDDRHAVYSCGFLQEDRTQMIVDYANEVAAIQALLDPEEETLCSPALALDDSNKPLSSKVRQKGALSSFHVPDEPLSAKVWTTRYGTNPKPEHHCRLQREERLALTRHATRWGCRLIIDPTIPYTNQGPKVRNVRLECLLKFLNSEEGRKSEVAISEGMPRTENITIVGNWFLAMAVAAVAGRGYYQTIFTRHAPIIQPRIAEFDEEFFRILCTQRVSPEDSREHAIHQIKALLEQPLAPFA